MATNYEVFTSFHTGNVGHDTRVHTTTINPKAEIRKLTFQKL